MFVVDADPGFSLVLKLEPYVCFFETHAYIGPFVGFETDAYLRLLIPPVLPFPKGG